MKRKLLFRIFYFPLILFYYLILATFLYVAHFAELPTVKFAVDSFRFMLPAFVVAGSPFVTMARMLKRNSNAKNH